MYLPIYIQATKAIVQVWELCFPVETHSGLCIMYEYAYIITYMYVVVETPASLHTHAHTNTHTQMSPKKAAQTEVLNSALKHACRSATYA